jgi:hypothetical protein
MKAEPVFLLAEDPIGCSGIPTVIGVSEVEARFPERGVHVASLHDYQQARHFSTAHDFAR